jgi:hypothetical protein
MGKQHDFWGLVDVDPKDDSFSPERVTASLLAIMKQSTLFWRLLFTMSKHDADESKWIQLLVKLHSKLGEYGLCGEDGGYIVRAALDALRDRAPLLPAEEQADYHAEISQCVSCLFGIRLNVIALDFNRRQLMSVDGG